MTSGNSKESDSTHGESCLKLNRHTSQLSCENYICFSNLDVVFVSSGSSHVSDANAVPCTITASGAVHEYPAMPASLADNEHHRPQVSETGIAVANLRLDIGGCPDTQSDHAPASGRKFRRWVQNEPPPLG